MFSDWLTHNLPQKESRVSRLVLDGLKLEWLELNVSSVTATTYYFYVFCSLRIASIIFQNQSVIGIRRYYYFNVTQDWNHQNIATKGITGIGTSMTPWWHLGMLLAFRSVAFRRSLWLKQGLTFKSLDFRGTLCVKSRQSCQRINNKWFKALHFYSSQKESSQKIQKLVRKMHLTRVT